MIPPNIVPGIIFLSVGYCMSLLWRSRRRRPLPHKNRGLSTKKTGVKESPPHLTHGTHRTHAWHTEHSSTGIAVEKYLQKKELELSTTLGCPPNSHCSSSSSSSSSSVTLVAACIYRRAAETPSSTDLQGPKKKSNCYVQNRKPQLYSADKLQHTRDATS